MESAFANVEIGDTLVRMLGGKIPIRVTVESLDETLIHCAGGWRFSRTNGAEIEEDPGWNEWRITGSYLLEPPPKCGTMRCWTESGSLYVIDYARQTWRRESNIPLVRSEPGVSPTAGEWWYVWPVVVGEGLRILLAVFDPTVAPRVVSSTPILRIEEEQQRA
jgi:hypothetical protein